jgi:hypothetical protein
MMPDNHPQTETETPSWGRTHRWSVERRLGFGALAALPLGLLIIAGVAGLTAASAGGSLEVATLLMYTHLGVQLIVLGIFVSLMASNRVLSDRGRLAWVLYFLLLAPAAVISYWYVHVWHAEAHTEREVVTESIGHAPAAHA